MSAQGPLVLGLGLRGLGPGLDKSSRLFKHNPQESYYFSTSKEAKTDIIAEKGSLEEVDFTSVCIC